MTENTPSDALAERDAEIARLNSAIKSQAAAVRTLQANEQTEINMLRAKAREAHAAVATLDSEREANARLTDELAERDAEIARLREALQNIRALATKRQNVWGPDGCLTDIECFASAALGSAKP